MPGLWVSLQQAGRVGEPAQAVNACRACHGSWALLGSESRILLGSRTKCQWAAGLAQGRHGWAPYD